MPDSTDCDEDLQDPLWTPIDCHGWTWVQTMAASPETHSLFVADGQLMGKVHQRFCAGRSPKGAVNATANGNIERSPK